MTIPAVPIYDRYLNKDTKPTELPSRKRITYKPLYEGS